MWRIAVNCIEISGKVLKCDGSGGMLMLSNVANSTRM